MKDGAVFAFTESLADNCPALTDEQLLELIEAVQSDSIPALVRGQVLKLVGEVRKQRRHERPHANLRDAVQRWIDEPEERELTPRGEENEQAMRDALAQERQGSVETPLRKCENPVCERRVPVGTKYCCSFCEEAHRVGYEIHEDGPMSHSSGCDARDRERRPWAYRNPTDHTDAEMAAAALVVSTRPPGWKTLIKAQAAPDGEQEGSGR